MTVSRRIIFAVGLDLDNLTSYTAFLTVGEQIASDKFSGDFVDTAIKEIGFY